MIFSVSNNEIQWTLDIGPDSVTIAVNDLAQNINNQLARNGLGCLAIAVVSKATILDNHLRRFHINPNQQGTFEMREEVPSTVGAQDLDTSSYQLTDLEDIEFNWENSQLDSVFKQGIDTPFSPTTFDDLSMKGSVENPIVLDEEEDKENSAPTTTTAVSECPTEPQDYWEVVLLEQEKKMYPIMFLELCFNKHYRVCVLIKNIINLFHFIITFFKN